MTTATEDRIAALTDARDEAARQMGIHYGRNPSAWYAAQAEYSKAQRELRQMEGNR